MTNSTITPNDVAVLTAVINAITSKPKTTAELKATKSDTPVVLTRGQVRALKFYNSAKKAEAKAKKRKDKYAAIVWALLGDSNNAVDENGTRVLELGYNLNTTYDKTILTERFPDAEAAARRPAPYAILKSTI